MSLKALLIVALLVIVVLGARKKYASRIVVPEHVHKVLRHADQHHVRYYPDFKYEGFSHPHEAQHPSNLGATPG